MSIIKISESNALEVEEEEEDCIDVKGEVGYKQINKNACMKRSSLQRELCRVCLGWRLQV